MRKTVVLITLLFICLILGQTSLSFGQKFPTKPIRYIVPFAAGGGTDIVARLIAKPMEKELGQKIFVENIPGGSTKVGTMACMEAKPDGYTICKRQNLVGWGRITPNHSIAKYGKN